MKWTNALKIRTKESILKTMRLGDWMFLDQISLRSGVSKAVATAHLKQMEDDESYRLIGEFGRFDTSCRRVVKRWRLLAKGERRPSGESKPTKIKEIESVLVNNKGEWLFTAQVAELTKSTVEHTRKTLKKLQIENPPKVESEMGFFGNQQRKTLKWRSVN